MVSGTNRSCRSSRQLFYTVTKTKNYNPSTPYHRSTTRIIKNWEGVVKIISYLFGEQFTDVTEQKYIERERNQKNRVRQYRDSVALFPFLSNHKFTLMINTSIFLVNSLTYQKKIMAQKTQVQCASCHFYKAYSPQYPLCTGNESAYSSPVIKEEK